MKSLCEFQYADEKGQDHGAQVRTKAKDIVELLSNPSALREKRRTRTVMRSDTLMNILNRAYETEAHGQNENEGRRDHSVDVPNTSKGDTIIRDVHGDTRDLLRAIEESKRTTVEGTSVLTSEEQDIFRAMELSLQPSEQVPRSHAASAVNGDPFSSPGASGSGFVMSVVCDMPVLCRDSMHSTDNNRTCSLTSQNPSLTSQLNLSCNTLHSARQCQTRHHFK